MKLHPFALLAAGTAAMLVPAPAPARAEAPRAASPTAGAPAPATSATPPRGTFAPPWNREGESFPGYSSFRDELVAHMRDARKRLAIVTPLLSDADVATALYAARMRGLQTMALLDTRGSRAYNSRHEYLARAKVPVWLVPLGGLRTESPSVLVVDDTAWNVGSHFDESAPGAVRVSAAGVTPDEIFSWRTSRGARFLQENFATPAVPRGAKESSRIGRPPAPEPVTIEGNQAQKQSGGRIPRRLPRETRLQWMTRGGSPRDGTEESTGSLKAPAPPPNETDVSD